MEIVAEQWDDQNPIPPSEPSFKITAPSPTVTVELHAEQFDHSKSHLLEGLGIVATPIMCCPDIIFLCFTLELTTTGKLKQASMKNRHSAEIMLRNLRELYCEANGLEETENIIDGEPRAFPAILTEDMLTISCHWVGYVRC